MRLGKGHSVYECWRRSRQTVRSCRLSAKHKPVHYGFNLSFSPQTRAIDAGERLKQVFDWSGVGSIKRAEPGATLVRACGRVLFDYVPFGRW